MHIAEKLVGHHRLPAPSPIERRSNAPRKFGTLSQVYSYLCLFVKCVSRYELVELYENPCGLDINLGLECELQEYPQLGKR
jgi:hypothetical protein